MEFHVLASHIMTRNQRIRALKYRLKHAKLKVMKDIDIDAKLKAIKQRNYVTNVCSDPGNSKTLSALVEFPGMPHYTRVVEIDLNTGIHTITPNKYQGKLLTYYKGLFHGHTTFGSHFPAQYVVYTGNKITRFNFPGIVREEPRLVDNCIVYDLNSMDIYKHAVVQLDKFTQDNIKDMKELPYTTFDFNADKQNKCSLNCHRFIPILKFRNIVGYIHVVSVNERIELTNNKDNKYIHSQQTINKEDHYVLTFGKVVLFAVKGKVKSKTTNNLKVDIYILNDSLGVINCHTEYSNFYIKDIYKLQIRQNLVLVVQYSKELRYMFYRRNRLINMCSYQRNNEIFDKASIMNHSKQNIVFFDRYSLSTMIRLII